MYPELEQEQVETEGLVEGEELEEGIQRGLTPNPSNDDEMILVDPAYNPNVPGQGVGTGETGADGSGEGENGTDPQEEEPVETEETTETEEQALEDYVYGDVQDFGEKSEETEETEESQEETDMKFENDDDLPF